MLSLKITVFIPSADVKLRVLPGLPGDPRECENGGDLIKLNILLTKTVFITKMSN